MLAIEATREDGNRLFKEGYRQNTHIHTHTHTHTHTQTFTFTRANDSQGDQKKATPNQKPTPNRDYGNAFLVYERGVLILNGIYGVSDET